VVVFLIICERMRAQGSSNARSLATTAHCLYPLASARIKKTTLVVVFLIMRPHYGGRSSLFLFASKTFFLEYLNCFFFALPVSVFV
jgi:hypothetical protein